MRSKTTQLASFTFSIKAAVPAQLTIQAVTQTVNGVADALVYTGCAL